MREAIFIWLVCVAPLLAADLPVYYDYVEDGQLTGGRVMIDTRDPAMRAAFGLDPVAVRGTWPTTTIRDNGPSDNRIDLVTVGDGYTLGELNDYAGHVEYVIESVLAEEPFGAYATFFNVHRVDVVSAESGVDEPDSGIYRDTALDMAYDCAGIARLLCVNTYKASEAAASAPAVDQVLALANSTRYGGAGYSNLATVAGDNSAAIDIALHELGHSFGDLADEYHYGDGATYTGSEPSEPNVSVYDTQTQIANGYKWHLWMDLPNVDTYEGARYNQYGIYRPTASSKMRYLSAPFHEVNAEQIVLAIYKVVSPIDDATPLSPIPLPLCTEFFVTPVEPVDHELDIQWAVDGVDVPGAVGRRFSAAPGTYAPGQHEVSVTVVDNTARVRDENLRRDWMTETRSWTIYTNGAVDECSASVPATSGAAVLALVTALLVGGGLLIIRQPSQAASA